MSVPLLPLTKPFITDKDTEAVAFSLKNLDIDCVEQFESAVAKYCGSTYAVAFCNGTTAKKAAYFASELNISDRVVASPNCPVSTVYPAAMNKNRIHLLDIDLTTGLLELDNFNDQLTVPSTRGKLILVPFHFSGNVLNVEKLDQLLSDPEAIIIEDASEAFGSRYSEENCVGSCFNSHMTVFSFNLSKIITTGQGGIVTTNDVNIFKKLQLYQNGGKEKKKLDQLSVADNYCTLTGNNKMTCFQAALGLSQLVQIEELLLKRQQIRKHYHQKLKEISQVDFLEVNSKFSSPHLMTIQIDFSSTKTNKEKIMRYLLDNGIETKICYPPLYQQDSLKYSLDCDKEYPSMDLYYERALTLPFYTDMAERQVNQICQLLKNALN